MQSVTKRCVFCQREITVGVDKRFDPLDVKRLEEKPAMCQGCAQERGLDPSEKYFVFAGDIYQKVSNVHLRLWPVGSFH